LLLLLEGCTKQVRPEKEIIKKDASLEELLTLYQIRRAALSDFKGLMEVTADFPQKGRHTFQSTVRSQKNQVRFRGFNFFGGTLFDLIVDGPAVSLTIPPENRKFEGTRQELEGQIQSEIPLGSIDLLEWISRGGVPDIKPFMPALEKGDDFFILYLLKINGRKASLVEKLWIERSAFFVKKIEMLDPAGAISMVLNLDDYRTVAGHFFPFSIEGESGGGKISVKFKEISPIAEGKP
jgi:hypothetical protein